MTGMDLLIGLIPPLVMTIIFIALLVTAYRATDRSRPRDGESAKQPSARRPPDDQAE